MGTRRTAPDPGLGASVELAGRELGGSVKLSVVGKALSREGISPEQPPPPFDEVQPAGPGRKRDLMYPGMECQPLLDWAAGVAGEIVRDEVELALGVRPVHLL
jgi:hypothetical protein